MLRDPEGYSIAKYFRAFTSFFTSFHWAIPKVRESSRKVHAVDYVLGNFGDMLEYISAWPRKSADNAHPVIS